jgi:HSF-type DNA-binding
MPNLATISPEHLSIASYPRTGKRGVPQQFARRLYEMLQSETKLAATTPEEDIFIQWSESGQAFRILDVKGFTSTVLPKYFRTKKFSSFQRNLNLVSVLDSQTERFSHFWSFTFSLTLVLLLLILFSMDFPKCDEDRIQTCMHTLPLSAESPSYFQNYESAHRLSREERRRAPLGMRVTSQPVEAGAIPPAAEVISTTVRKLSLPSLLQRPLPTL